MNIEGTKVRHLSMRFDPDYYRQLEDTARGLGLDPTQLCRMIIRENLGAYVMRAEKACRSEKKNGSEDG